MPSAQKKVVAVYIVAGFGHLKPAISLIEEVSQKGYPVETEAWDLFADATGESILDKNSIYNRISTHPLYIQFWNRFSSSTSPTKHFAGPAQWWDLVSKRDHMKRFRHAVQENPNTIFFCTHFTPANLASKALPNHKVFLYITDIHPHPIWAVKR